MAGESLTPTAAQLSAQFNRQMGLIRAAQVAGAREGLTRVGAMLTAEVKRLISQPYPPASVPGEPPHRRRGEDGGLMSSYGYDVQGTDSVIVGSGGADPPLLPVYLEFGTGRMRPRPHLRPAVTNLLQGGRGGQIGAAFAEAVEAAIRRAT